MINVSKEWGIKNRQKGVKLGTLQFCQEPKNHCFLLIVNWELVNSKAIRGSGQNSLFLQN
jgi:hypothetical protein